MRCLAVCQDELVIRMLDEILLPGFEVQFIVENRSLARRLHEAGTAVTVGDPRRTETYLKADIGKTSGTNNFSTHKLIPDIFGTTFTTGSPSRNQLLLSQLNIEPYALNSSGVPYMVKISYEIRYNITEYANVVAIEAEIMHLLWYRFKRNGIEVPMPVRDVHLREITPATIEADERHASAAKRN